MTDGLVDKGIDDDERDDAPDGSRHRSRRALIGGGAVAALAIGGLAITQPWSDDDKDAAPRGATITIERPDAQPVEPEISNRLALSAVPEGFVPVWVGDFEQNDVVDDESVMAANVLLVGQGANYADGPWLGVTVRLLDKFERKDFDPLQFLMASEGQKVLINGLDGVFAKSEFDGDTSELAFGPVNEGYVVVLSTIGLTQAEMVAIANQLTLQEADDEAVAWPQFGAKVGELGLTPLASYELPSTGFGGGFQLGAIGGSSATSTSVNYSSDDDDFIAVSNDVAVSGLDSLAMARFVLSSSRDVTVHDQPAVTGDFDAVLGGSVVIWNEAGRSMSVFASGDVDVVALAESVTELDDQSWADLAAEAEANDGDDFGDGSPEETWLVNAGELEDGTTWLVEGAVDDDGNISWCTAAMQPNSSSTGCSVVSNSEPPAIDGLRGVGADGLMASAYVAIVPLDAVGALLRFTAGDGTVVDTAFHEVRPDWPFLAAAVAVTDTGSLEIIAADGTILETMDITVDDLDMAFG